MKVFGCNCMVLVLGLFLLQLKGSQQTIYHLFKPALFGTSFLVCTPFNFLLRSACTCAENNSIHSSFSATTLSQLAPPNIFTAVCLSLSNSLHPSSPFIPCFTLIFILRRHHHTFAMLRCATSVGVK